MKRYMNEIPAFACMRLPPLLLPNNPVTMAKIAVIVTEL